MKIVRFTTGGRAEYGTLDEKVIHGIEGTPYRRLKHSSYRYQLSDVKLLPPCTPSKIVAIGLNYFKHGTELKMAIPSEPLIFIKPSTAVIGPDDEIRYPDSSEQVDYEAELGVVIKTRTSRVAEAKALDHVLGYTCFNDITARDLQKKDGQWTRAKGFDTFAAIGPWIETELDPGNTDLEARLNGEVKQRGNTRDLIFSVPRLISFISHIMTLLPGDVIATGTPEGVGPMNPGDTIEIKINKIGTLRNYVVKK
jgi:2-keto-4-pentenoate hydratase/2-oxohepta-3-ene-1,7-dioic acid hydratase in catechol pathway